MVTPLRRGKIRDTALTAFILIVFGVVPIALLLTQDNGLFRDQQIETAYTAVLVLSWPFFCLGGTLLLYFWRKDRSVDKAYFSTATRRQLSIISGALVSVTLGCVLLFAGILLSTINRFQRRHNTIHIVLDIVSMVLVSFITYQVVAVIFEVRNSKKSVEDFARNQTFADAPQQQQSTPGQQQVVGGARPPSSEPSEPTFV